MVSAKSWMAAIIASARGESELGRGCDASEAFRDLDLIGDGQGDNQARVLAAFRLGACAKHPQPGREARVRRANDLAQDAACDADPRVASGGRAAHAGRGVEDVFGGRLGAPSQAVSEEEEGCHAGGNAQACPDKGAAN